MTSEAKRHTEVKISKLTEPDKKKFNEAKDKELDQWVSHAVVKVCQRAGVPLHRIMSMRWVLTWKATDDGKDRKASGEVATEEEERRTGTQIEGGLDTEKRSDNATTGNEDKESAEGRVEARCPRCVRCRSSASS